MPISISELLETVKLKIAGRATWGETTRENKSGVYVISLTPDAQEKPKRLYEMAPIDLGIVKEWIAKVPQIKLDSRKPSAEELAERLKQFWLPDENIVYIGKTDIPIRYRINQFYRTPLGEPRPHRGGHWLKSLRILNNLTIFWAVTNKPGENEKQMLKTFTLRVSELTKKNLGDPNLPLPFANLELNKGQRKKHGITSSTLPKHIIPLL